MLFEPRAKDAGEKLQFFIRSVVNCGKFCIGSLWFFHISLRKGWNVENQMRKSGYCGEEVICYLADDLPNNAEFRQFVGGID